MTGFGRGEGTSNSCTVVCEIKTVNSKYLDINAKLPKSYAAFEPKIKEILTENHIFRGKTDIWFDVSAANGDGRSVNVDIDLAEQYLDALRTLGKELGLKGKVALKDIVSRPDVLSVVERSASEEDFFKAAHEALAKAAGALVVMREAEGEKLYADITSRIANCRALTDEIDALSESSKSGYFSRLEERLRAVLADNRITPDEARMLTECAIFADRVSVDEETVRLRAHFDAFMLLIDEESCGRRLDFLVQEMNREANTVGSKCSDSTIAHKVVSLKNEIEKIREQIQNIE